VKHIASCSFGEDSMATVITARRQNEPLDEVVYCEVMFDKGISGEIPEHREFIYSTAIPRLKSWGIKTTVLQSTWTYIDHFNFVITRGERKGKLRSFALCGICSVKRDCKLPPIAQYQKSLSDDVVQYIGICNDEEDRLLSMDGISLLEKYGISKSMTGDICKSEGMRSPIYEFTNRGGCWFCPNAKEKELRHLYDHHPDLWVKMLELQALPNKATDKFNRTMRFDEIDANFRFDDMQMNLCEQGA